MELRTAEPRNLRNPRKLPNLTKITYFDRNICFFTAFSIMMFKTIVTSDKFVNKFMNKTLFPLSYLWRTGRSPYLTYLRPRRIFFLGWDPTLSRLSNHVCTIMLLRKLLVRFQTARNSYPSVSRKVRPLQHSDHVRLRVMITQTSKNLGRLRIMKTQTPEKLKPLRITKPQTP